MKMQQLVTKYGHDLTPAENEFYYTPDQMAYYYGKQLTLEQRKERDERWKSITDVPHIEPKDHINFRYEIVKSLGEGVFGRVYEVIDHGDEAKPRLAMKIIFGQHMEKLHEKEINILSDIAKYQTEKKDTFHLLSMKGHGFIQRTGNGFILFPIYKRSLQRLLLERPETMDIIAVQKYTKQMMIFLKALKDLNFVHADIKPANIMLDSNNNLVLIDVGFAEPLNSPALSYEIIRGTYAYMAPDRFFQRDYNLASDMWSSALTLIKMLNKVDRQMEMFLITIGLPPDHLMATATDTAKTVVEMKKRDKGFLKRKTFLQQNIDSFAKEDTNKQAWDLASRMLQWAPDDRITPEDALDHAFIKDIKE